jgi:hypothetical protein
MLGGVAGAEGGMATEGASRYGYGGTGGEGESRGGYGYGYGAGGSGMEGRYGPGGTEGPMTEDQERDMLTGGRYLGPDGKPLGGGGDMAMADPAADPAAAVPAAPLELGVEYKRLPVRMSLQMDQRWLTHLITECANQPLQVEVQEVRINPSDFAGASGGGFQSISSGYGRGGGEGAFGGGGASLFPERTGIQTFSAYPNLVNVVVQGTIYIFNPPDPAVLQAGEETQVADASSVQ